MSNVLLYYRLDHLCNIATNFLIFSNTGWSTKMSLFFIGDNFYKNKDTFKIFSPQILEVYRILLVETTLESIMFYYTFSVINTMFVPCTALLYDSTAATRTLKLSTTPLSISCGIHLISLLIMSSLVCGLFSQTLSFTYPPQKIVTWVEILGIGWPGVIDLTRNESLPWEVVPEVFKCTIREMRQHLISQTEHLNTWHVTSYGTDSFCVKPITPGHPIPKILKQFTDKKGYHQKRNQMDSTRNAQWSCGQF